MSLKNAAPPKITGKNEQKFVKIRENALFLSPFFLPLCVDGRATSG